MANRLTFKEIWQTQAGYSDIVKIEFLSGTKLFTTEGSSSDSNILSCWSIPNKEPIKYIGHKQQITSFDTRSDLIVTGGMDKKVVVWSNEGKVLRKFKEKKIKGWKCEAFPFSVIFAKYNHILTNPTSANKINVWNIKGKHLQSITLPEFYHVRKIIPIPNIETCGFESNEVIAAFMVLGDSPEVQIYGIRHQSSILFWKDQFSLEYSTHFMPKNSTIIDAVFPRDKEKAYLCDSNGNVLILDLITEKADTLCSSLGDICGLALSPEQDYLAVEVRGDGAYIIDSSSGNQISHIPEPDITSIVFGPDNQIAIGTFNGDLKVLQY